MAIDKAFEDYILTIVKPYKTMYKYFHVFGSTIIATCEFGSFYIEIDPIYNPDNYSFGFTVETIDKVSYILPDEVASIILMKKYYFVHNYYMQEVIHKDIYPMDDERFVEINAESSQIQCRNYNFPELEPGEKLVTTINGSYIKLNKSDTLSLNIYQNKEMRYNKSMLFEYILYKPKQKLNYHLITLQLRLD